MLSLVYIHVKVIFISGIFIFTLKNYFVADIEYNETLNDDSVVYVHFALLCVIITLLFVDW